MSAELVKIVCWQKSWIDKMYTVDTYIYVHIYIYTDIKIYIHILL